jgi:4-amino-4-deoxy-L-arabinose transferase-like glycosyltransferase
VGWDDSAEFAAGVTNVGVVHPTGYPAYLLGAKGFQILDPFGSEAEQVSLFSALLAALSVGLVAAYVLRLTASRLAACAAALLLGTGGLYWQHATTASQYPLYVCAFLALLLFTDRWSVDRSPWSLAGVSASAGLVAISHRTGLVIAGATVAYVLFTSRRDLLRRGNALALGAALVPLATVAYLPLRADAAGFPNHSRDEHLSWWELLNGGGDPDGRLLGASASAIQDHATILVYLVLSQLSVAALALIPAGARLAVRSRSLLWCGIVPSVLISAAVVTTPGAFPHWHFPLLTVGAIVAGAGVAVLSKWFARHHRPIRHVTVAALVAAILAVPLVGARHLGKTERDASPWGREVLQGLPPRATVLAPWPAFSVLRAMQEIEGQRPDVRVGITPGYGPDYARLDSAGASHVVVIHVDGESEGPPSRLQPVGPPAEVQVRGLTELRLGPKLIGLPSLSARLYRVAR